MVVELGGAETLLGISTGRSWGGMPARSSRARALWPMVGPAGGYDPREGEPF